MVSKPVVSNLLLALSLAGMVLVQSEVMRRVRLGMATAAAQYVTLVFLIAAAVCALGIYWYPTVKQERIALFLQIGCLIIIDPYLYGYVPGKIALCCMVLVEIAIYERWPVSGLLSIVFFALYFGTEIVWNLIGGRPLPWGDMAAAGVSGAVVSAAVIAMVRYREFLVEARQDIERIREALKQLTKTNLEYQDYALDIEESAAEQERNRITRDIHDVVGYTLTNTIMMMEAAIDMMRRNPLGVASLINTARENAQEGLEETRRALYKLREKQVERPKGLTAVMRMIKIFSTATGVDIELLWNNLPWTFDDVRDFIIFHSIQQGLINAFIHGKATRVVIQNVIRDRLLVLTLKDNGIGSGDAPIIEGIGLKGLRERLERIEGRYEVQSMFDGFLLTVLIPLEAEPSVPSAPEGES